MRKRQSLLSREEVRLETTPEQAFANQLDEVSQGKSPIPVIYEKYRDKISAQDDIKKATDVNTLKILSEEDD